MKLPLSFDESSIEAMSQVLRKSDFWKKNRETQLNSRQMLKMDKLLDGFLAK